MPRFNWLDLEAVLRSIGRGVVFYSASRWDPSTGAALSMFHLGDTEGDITLNSNPTVEHLTTPELSGALPKEADYVGDAPVVEIPLYLAAPSLHAIVSPTGSAHAGRSIRGSVVERSLAVFPERLLVGLVDGEPTRLALEFEGGVWSLGGAPLTADKQALLSAGAVWFWRGYFNRPTRRWLAGAGDARKAIETATFVVMDHPEMPEGCRAYVTGDPAEVGIDLEGGS
jgi:hypothetical protein